MQQTLLALAIALVGLTLSACGSATTGIATTGLTEYAIKHHKLTAEEHYELIHKNPDPEPNEAAVEVSAPTPAPTPIAAPAQAPKPEPPSAPNVEVVKQEAPATRQAPVTSMSSMAAGIIEAAQREHAATQAKTPVAEGVIEMMQQGLLAASGGQ